MAIDIGAALAKSANAIKFSDRFVSGYTPPAFGARSKAEIDLLVFICLIEARAIDPEAPVYDIARALNITPTRVRSLIFNWQLRTTSKENDLRPDLVAALKKTRFSSDGTFLTFGVESPLLKEEIIARLKRKGVFSDASFAKEIVRLPVDAFVEFLEKSSMRSSVTLLARNYAARVLLFPDRATLAFLPVSVGATEVVRISR
jgi:hypothetical protein